MENPKVVYDFRSNPHTLGIEVPLTPELQQIAENNDVMITRDQKWKIGYLVRSKRKEISSTINYSPVSSMDTSRSLLSYLWEFDSLTIRPVS